MPKDDYLFASPKMRATLDSLAHWVRMYQRPEDEIADAENCALCQFTDCCCDLCPLPTVAHKCDSVDGSFREAVKAKEQYAATKDPYHLWAFRKGAGRMISDLLMALRQLNETHEPPKPEEDYNRHVEGRKVDPESVMCGQLFIRGDVPAIKNDVGGSTDLDDGLTLAYPEGKKMSMTRFISVDELPELMEGRS